MGPNQTYKLLHIKKKEKSINKTKQKCTDWEKTANDVTNKGLISKIYKQLIQLKKKKTKPN